MRDALGVLADLFERGLVGGRGRGVELAPGLGRDRVEDDLAVHRRREGALSRPGDAEEIARSERGDRPVDLGQALLQELGEDGDEDRLAEDRRSLHRGALALRETAHACSDQHPEAAWHRGRAVEPRLHFAVHHGDRGGVAELAKQLLEEERVSTGALAAEGKELGREKARADSSRDQARGVLLTELADRQRVVRGVGGDSLVRRLARREGEDGAEPARLARPSSLDGVEDRRERRGVERVRVVPNEDVQSIVGEALEHPGEAAPERAGHIARRGARLVLGQSAELGKHRVGLFGLEAEGAEARDDLADLRLVVAVLNAAEDLEHRGEPAPRNARRRSARMRRRRSRTL